MNFELADKLNELIKNDQLDKAIEFTQGELKGLPSTDFHKILDRDLLHQTSDLASYVNQFHKSAITFFECGKKGLLNSLFGKKSDTGKTLKAMYSEMNGFTINYDRWYIDLFAYDQFNGLEDLDWLAEFEYDSENSLTITGFEDLQAAYQDYMENEKWKEERLKQACEVCELLIILRLQQLFEHAYLDNKTKNYEWTNIPVLVTAHDHELVYNATKK